MIDYLPCIIPGVVKYVSNCFQCELCDYIQSYGMCFGRFILDCIYILFIREFNLLLLSLQTGVAYRNYCISGNIDSCHNFWLILGN